MRALGTTTPATLPTVLGALLLILGLYAALRPPAETPTPADAPVDVGQVTSTTFVERPVSLVNAATDETRTADVRAPETEAVPLRETLAALRTWLVEEGLWPEALGVPTVFQLGASAVLDFPLPLNVSLDISVQQEQQLLASVERTLAQQGVAQVYVLTNGQARAVFLRHLAVPRALE